MNILVTGACGYKGNVLVRKLLTLGHKVTAFDIMWFGNDLPIDENLEIVCGDIRNIDSVPLVGVDVIIHLASIANDPSGDLNPKLTWETSALATMQLIDRAHRLGIRRFIYASSGSVYGVKEEPEIVESLELVPLTEYNKTKMVAERVILSYQSEMTVQVVRPATVCGYSPRMRLDVSVNMLTMQALQNGLVTVFGGEQIRPNIHIDDIVDVYCFLLERPDLIGVFNAGFENMSIRSLAELICSKTNAEFVVSDTNDPRSYRLSSRKLTDAGFLPKKSVGTAIDELVAAYKSGTLKNEARFHTLAWMKHLGIDRRY